MAKIIFITGGAASGKTRWAVSHFESCDDVMYMCVADELESDTKSRIEYNCNKLGIEWNIVTKAEKLSELLEGRKFSILDSLGAYVDRAVKRACPDMSNMNEELRHTIEKQVINEIEEAIDCVKEMNGNLIIITIEQGFCPIPTDEAQKWFRKIIGDINQRIANQSTEVYLSASGIQFRIK